MAEAEITIRDDDELLREINQQIGTVGAMVTLSSQRAPRLRPRGSCDSVQARDRYPLEDTAVFDSCQHCNIPLAGCVTGGVRPRAWSLVMTCGHVLCEACKSACRRTGQKSADAPPLHECPVCGEYGAVNRLPCRESVNHERVTSCARHETPVTARCTCGELVCTTCPYNYFSHVPGTSRKVHHMKTAIDEVELALEDEMADTIGTLSRIRGMRSVAVQKRRELEETTDRMANEVALHFNQIIIQAIQRCFDMLTGLKQVAGAHHSSIINHLRMLDRTERQLIVGVEMDERARNIDAVRRNDVSQYVRNVSYGLCKPAFKEFEKRKEFSERLEESSFGLTIETPSTREIVDLIGRWGERVFSNADDTSEEMTETRIARSVPQQAASLVTATEIPAILSGAPICATEIPLRLHTALEHFTDLYERRFHSESMLGEAPVAEKRDLPFQLGEREAPEANMTEEEQEARHAYERVMLSRLGMYQHQPKIFGGIRRLYNLVDRPFLVQKEVQATFDRTPCLAPIWMAKGGNPAEIPPLKATRGQQGAAAGAGGGGTPPLDLQRLLQQPSGARTERRASAASSVASRPATPAADDGVAAAASSAHEAPSSSSPPAAPPTVLRKRNLVFVKKTDEDAQQKQQAAPLPPPAPSRPLPPTILRRPPPQQHSFMASKLHFRPATFAERAAAAGPLPAAKKPLLLTDGAAAQKRPFRIVHSPGGAGGLAPRPFRDASGAMPMVRRVPGAMFGTRPAIQQPGTSGAGDANRPPIRVNTLRVMGSAEKRRFPGADRPGMSMGSATTKARPAQTITKVMDSHLAQLERDKSTQPLSNLRVIVPSIKGGATSIGGGGGGANVARPRHPIAADATAAAEPSATKGMLPIERAFANLFGADGSLIPAFSFRRRGRPAKDDPTAPSNILAQFKKNTTQWPPKFDEMDAQEEAELRDLINQLDTAREEEEREEALLLQNGVKLEEDDSSALVSHWQSFTAEERERIRATAQERLKQQGSKANGGCFVCNLFRKQGEKPRTWQCTECIRHGRPLTPIREGEIVDEPPSKKRATEDEEAAPDSSQDEQMEEEEESNIDLSALFKQEKIDRRGRPRKNKDTEPTPKEQQRAPREAKKRRELPAVEEETAPEEEVVMGTTRRGRQIKMPAKLKGHEVNTASTTRRSVSAEGEERSSPHHSPASTPRTSPMKKKVEEKLKEIKEETPEPRSAMDPLPRRGGRRRH